MYAITGATGNTGKRIALALLEAGKQVRIISRDAEKAKELTDKGAELIVGDTTDETVLTKAFEGAEAVYAMIPPNFQSDAFTQYQENAAKAIASAIKSNGVKYAVTLSSQGAHLSEGSGVVLGLYKMEKILNAVEGLNVLHLRPTYFMENSLGMAGMLKESGIMGAPVKADLVFPVIATQDIADYATKRLLALDFSGKSVQDLLGPRDVTYKEMTQVYASAVGKPEAPYVEFSYGDFKQAMMQGMGLSDNVADMFIEFIQSMNDGRAMVARRTEESTTPTTIEEFAQTFKYVYSVN